MGSVHSIATFIDNSNIAKNDIANSNKFETDLNIIFCL